MSEALANYETLMQNKATLLLLGLAFVFMFQFVVFRWAERSNLVTASYFLASIALVGGPFAAVALETPHRVFDISDQEIVWTLLSFLMTVIGIGCSPSPQRSSAATRVALLHSGQ
jgi:hypothetical protein